MQQLSCTWMQSASSSRVSRCLGILMVRPALGRWRGPPALLQPVQAAQALRMHLLQAILVAAAPPWAPAPAATVVWPPPCCVCGRGSRLCQQTSCQSGHGHLRRPSADQLVLLPRAVARHSSSSHCLTDGLAGASSPAKTSGLRHRRWEGACLHQLDLCCRGVVDALRESSALGPANVQWLLLCCACSGVVAGY